VKKDPAYEYYTVQAGDNPYSISKKFPGTTADGIMQLNRITDPSKLRIGQNLKIRKK
jgi:LysM repeat protein